MVKGYKSFKIISTCWQTALKGKGILFSVSTNTYVWTFPYISTSKGCGRLVYVYASEIVVEWLVIVTLNLLGDLGIWTGFHNVFCLLDVLSCKLSNSNLLALFSLLGCQFVRALFMLKTLTFMYLLHLKWFFKSVICFEFTIFSHRLTLKNCAVNMSLFSGCTVSFEKVFLVLSL